MSELAQGSPGLVNAERGVTPRQVTASDPSQKLAVDIYQIERPADRSAPSKRAERGAATMATGPYSQAGWDAWRRVAIWIVILMAHIGLWWVAVRLPIAFTPPHSQIERLVIVSLAASDAPPITSSEVVSLLAAEPIVAEQPVIDATIAGEDESLALIRRTGRIVPPHPAEAVTDSKTFARQAGLSVGTGATVVVRLEVLGSGAVGRVQIEVSGGTPQIDEAAVACVRAMKWIGGRVDSQPVPLWIRWGVRFDG